MALQASLQHVVLTYDPVNGRQIYVNGVNVGGADPQKGGTISNWDNTFALVLGNEVSGDRSWQGLIKFVAIHSRALTPAQIVQNFNAGVGQRYYMLFDVSSVTGLNKAYIMFTVSQYDSFSYMFYKPTFVSLDPTVKPNNIPIQGIRIGINGAIPTVGQAYIPLNTMITAANYTSQGEVLSSIGTVIGLESGPLVDTFFLQFDRLAGQTNVIAEPVPVAPPTPLGPVAADIGVRSFAQVNSTFSQITGVPKTNAAVAATYLAVQQQLPPNSVLEGYSSANQVGVAQLAVQYCNTMMKSYPTSVAKMFPGATFNGSQYATAGGISTVANDLANAVSGSTQLKSQSVIASATATELTKLITTLCTSSSCSGNAAREQAVTSAACAAALGNANVLIY
jgi:Concanavalin A-like lectin/glucanases superfamily